MRIFAAFKRHLRRTLGKTAQESSMGYHIDLTNFLDLSGVERKFVSHFTKAMMTGGLGSYPEAAIKTNFIRLVDSAIDEYEEARRLTSIYWAPSNVVRIGSWTVSSSHFETCLTNAHRAIGHMEALLQAGAASDVANAIKSPPLFMEPTVIKKMNLIRNQIQHVEENVLRGKIIRPGTNFFPVADGPDQDRGTETFKVIDRIKIGTIDLMFSDLCPWLRDMARCAGIIASL
jgi:hypothetical protein